MCPYPVLAASLWTWTGTIYAAYVDRKLAADYIITCITSPGVFSDMEEVCQHSVDSFTILR